MSGPMLGVGVLFPCGASSQLDACSPCQLQQRMAVLGLLALSRIQLSRIRWPIVDGELPVTTR
jgi:hypothetical protein